MNIGIVGCGYVSKVHLDAIRENSNCKIVSLCDLDEKRAKELASSYNVQKVYTDFSQMLQKENLDIVHVLTPPQTHESLSIKAMEAGCNVLVEKPMCVTVEEAENMIKAAKQNNVILGVVHSFLFNPAISRALAAVNQKEIGELLWVDTQISIHSLLRWADKPGFPTWYQTLPGGLFGEIIPHGIYVQLAFLGKIKNALGYVTKRGVTSELVPYSELHVTMEGENAIGSLLMSTRVVSPYTVFMVRVVGSEGILLAEVPSATVFKIDVGGSNKISSRALMNLKPAFQLISNTASLGVKTMIGSVKPHMTHSIIIRQFVESVINKTKPLVTAEDGREVIKAINMIWGNIFERGK
jgi:predicted dehydrogenase